MALGQNSYDNSMSSFYRSKLNKTPEATQAPDPMEAAAKSSQFDINYNIPMQSPIQEAPAASEKVGTADLGLKPAPEAAYEPSSGDKAIKNASTLAKASGQPEAEIAAAVLDTATGVYQAQQQQKMARYNAEIAKVNARQNAVSQLANLGAGLKA